MCVYVHKYKYILQHQMLSSTLFCISLSLPSLPLSHKLFFPLPLTKIASVRACVRACVHALLVSLCYHARPRLTACPSRTHQIPVYGDKRDRIRRFCASHRLQGFVQLNRRLCVVEGCQAKATYGGHIELSLFLRICALQYNVHIHSYTQN
jgi:hypothetical protein